MAAPEGPVFEVMIASPRVDLYAKEYQDVLGPVYASGFTGEEGTEEDQLHAYYSREHGLGAHVVQLCPPDELEGTRWSQLPVRDGSFKLWEIKISILDRIKKAFNSWVSYEHERQANEAAYMGHVSAMGLNTYKPFYDQMVMEMLAEHEREN